MPPKKSKATKAAPPKTEEPKEEEQVEQKQAEQPKPKPKGKAQQNGNDNTNEDRMELDSNTSKKRKSPPTAATNTKAPPKIPRQGSRSSGRTPASTEGPSIHQTINFLLSAQSIPYCYPEDELNASKSKEFKKTYSMTPPSSFNPFEQLIIAHCLSKPLSHTLGMRSIRTLLNPPYSLNTPQKIKEAGEKRVWEGLEAARTQHRQKTAAYIYQMAETYCDDETMYKLSEEVNEDGADGVVRHIKETVKGMGQTGAELFCRRIQACDGWGEAVWPFADSRCIDALRELGIKVASGDELQELVEKEVDWDKVGDMGLTKLVGTGRDNDESPDDMDHEQRVQVEFVVLLERAVGCVLEGKVSELKKAAREAA